MKSLLTLKRKLWSSLILLICVIALPTLSNAQNAIHYQKGYTPNVEISWANNGQFSIVTTQAYNFANGLALGVGTGFTADFLGDDFAGEYVDVPNYLIPLFVNVNYSFLDKNVSPLVGLRLGEMFDVTNSGLVFNLSPYVGLNFSRFSFLVGYELQKNVAKLSEWAPENYLDNSCLNKIRIGFAFTF